MFFLRQKKLLNTGVFSEADYTVLNYEQLLEVNGAGGSGSGGGGGGGPSGPTGGSGSNLTDQGYPSSTDYNPGIPPSNGPYTGSNLTDQGYPSSTDPNPGTPPSSGPYTSGSGSCGGGCSSSSGGSCSGGNETQTSAKDKISTSISENSDKKYNKDGDGYRCDNWVEEVLSDAGYNPKDYYVDNPNGKEVKDHISELKASGKNNYSTTIPTKEGVYVVFMDGKGSLGTLDPHCGILTVSSNGEMSFTHNSSSNDNHGVDTWSVTSQNNGTKLGGLAYSNFYFQEIK